MAVRNSFTVNWISDDSTEGQSRLSHQTFRHREIHEQTIVSWFYAAHTTWFSSSAWHLQKTSCDFDFIQLAIYPLINISQWELHVEKVFPLSYPVELCVALQVIKQTHCSSTSIITRINILDKLNVRTQLLSIAGLQFHLLALVMLGCWHFFQMNSLNGHWMV